MVFSLEIKTPLHPNNFPFNREIFESSFKKMTAVFLAALLSVWLFLWLTDYHAAAFLTPS